MIDLCFICVRIVQDERIPVRIHDDTKVGRILCEINSRLARQLAEPHPEVKLITVNGDVLPMVAIVTINGSRLCGMHVNTPWKKIFE